MGDIEILPDKTGQDQSGQLRYLSSMPVQSSAAANVEPLSVSPPPPPPPLPQDKFVFIMLLLLLLLLLFCFGARAVERFVGFHI